MLPMSNLYGLQAHGSSKLAFYSLAFTLSGLTYTVAQVSVMGNQHQLQTQLHFCSAALKQTPLVNMQTTKETISKLLIPF